MRREGASFTTGERKDRGLGADSRCGSNGLEASLDGSTVRRQRSAGPELLVGFDGLRNRMSNFFSRTESSSQLPQPSKPYIALFNSPKPKDRKRAGITMGHVSQVFAVYPERPELITRSTLIKIEGFLGDDELAGEWRSREGWLLLMPEVETGKACFLRDAKMAHW